MIFLSHIQSQIKASLKTSLAFAVSCILAAPVSGAEPGPEAKQVVAIGGAITEIIYALGQQDRLVARDTTSNYPAEAKSLPDVGYARALSPEGVLSVGPDLIIATDNTGPPEALDVLKQANVTYVEIPEIYSAEGVTSKIEAVGKALGQDETAAALVTQVRADLEAAQTLAIQAAGDSPKSVLFVLSTAGGRITVAGTETGADGIIQMAGGVNAVTEFTGFKQMSDEAIAELAPDVILAMDRGGDHGITADSIKALPGLMLTPAAQNGHIIRMDGALLLQFGPRAATAVKDLAHAIYGAAP